MRKQNEQIIPIVIQKSDKVHAFIRLLCWIETFIMKN